MESFCKNYIKIQLKKYRRLIPHDTDEWCKVHLWFRIWHEEFGEFSPNHYFCPKYVRFELKNHKVVIFHDTEQRCKIWINPDLVVSKMAWRVGWTFIRANKSLKIVHWWAVFVQSIYFSVRKFQRRMTLKDVARFKRKLTCGLKNDIRNSVNFHASSWKSENLHFNWIHLSKAYKYLDEQVQKSYVSRHWRVTQSLKKKWLWFQKLNEEFGEF